MESGKKYLLLGISIIFVYWLSLKKKLYSLNSIKGPCKISTLRIRELEFN